MIRTKERGRNSHLLLCAAIVASRSAETTPCFVREAQGFRVPLEEASSRILFSKVCGSKRKFTNHFRPPTTPSFGPLIASACANTSKVSAPPHFSSLLCSKAMTVSVLFLIRSQQVSFRRIRVKMGECRRSAQRSPQTDQSWRRLASRNCSCTSGESCNERRAPLGTK